MAFTEGQQNPQDFEILVEFIHGGATETHWFALDKVEAGESETLYWFKRSNPITLFPELQPEQQAVRSYEIQKFRRRP